MVTLNSFAVFGSEFRLVTVANQQRKELKLLKQQSEELGFTLDVLGMGGPWYPGCGMKFVHLQKYVETLADDDIIMFVDAFDIYLLGDKEEF
jgi:hypothetical protein